MEPEKQHREGLTLTPREMQKGDRVFINGHTEELTKEPEPVIFGRDYKIYTDQAIHWLPTLKKYPVARIQSKEAYEKGMREAGWE